MESGIEIKQNYLIMEILEKGYDAKEFLEYIVFKKGENGADLEQWSLSDLKEVNYLINLKTLNFIQVVFEFILTRTDNPREDTEENFKKNEKFNEYDSDHEEDSNVEEI